MTQLKVNKMFFETRQLYGIKCLKTRQLYANKMFQNKTIIYE